MVTPISSMPGDCASASMATPSSKPSTMSLSKITFSRADTGKAHNRDTITPKTTSHSRFHRLMPSFLSLEGEKRVTRFSDQDGTRRRFGRRGSNVRENVFVPVVFPADALAAPRASRMADERP